VKKPGVAGLLRQNASGLLEAADGVLDLAFGLVGLAFGLELRIAENLAGAFLEVALELLGGAFHAVVVGHRFSPR
jgi:hypothetical protein